MGHGPLDMLCHGQLAGDAVIAVPCLCMCGNTPGKSRGWQGGEKTPAVEGLASGGFPDPCAQSWKMIRVLFLQLGPYQIPTGSWTGS